MTTHTRCILAEGTPGRWHIASIELERRAWTGTRWAPCSTTGETAGFYRVQQFNSAHAALTAALRAGLDVEASISNTEDEPWKPGA